MSYIGDWSAACALPICGFLGGGELLFSGDQTLGGTGEVRFAGNLVNSELRVLNSLIVASGVTLHGTNGTIETGPGGLINRSEERRVGKGCIARRTACAR